MHRARRLIASSESLGQDDEGGAQTFRRGKFFRRSEEHRFVLWDFEESLGLGVFIHRHFDEKALIPAKMSVFSGLKPFEAAPVDTGQGILATTMRDRSSLANEAGAVECRPFNP